MIVYRIKWNDTVRKRPWIVCNAQRFKAILRQHPSLFDLAEVQAVIVADEDWVMIHEQN